MVKKKPEKGTSETPKTTSPRRHLPNCRLVSNHTGDCEVLPPSGGDRRNFPRGQRPSHLPN